MTQHIVLIDDDSDERLFLSESISPVCADFKLVHFENGHAAIGELRITGAIIPAIIFVDIHMPRMDGWECMSVLKTIPVLFKVPIVIYSIDINPANLIKAKKMGAHSFISKADESKQLETTLCTLLKLAS